MLKVSVTLPNGAEITCEASDPSLCSQMLEMVLKDLPGDLMSGGQRGRHPASLAIDGGCEALSEVSSVQSEHSEHSDHSNGASAVMAESQATSTPAESEFAEYCRSVAPVGDMRRVVLVAWAANHFLGTSSISDRELSRMFQLVGWRKPESFTQALRNAARSKFRWLERIPGRSGYYSATDVGIRAVVPTQDL